MTKDFTEKTLSSERIYEGCIINLRVDTVQLPDGGQSRREIVEHRGAVAIVPLLDDGRVILVKQFRKTAQKHLFEIPAGTLDANESPEACALRELLEETGYHAGKLTKLAAFYLAPGYSTELLHTYLARSLTPSEQHLEADEFAEPITVSLEEALQWIDEGRIQDAKTISALLITWRRQVWKPR